MTFDITTDPLVSSATMIFDNGKILPTDKITDGKFSMSTVMLVTGENVISVEVMALGEKQFSTGVLRLFVDQDTLIHNVTFKLDPQTKKDLEMSWSILGKPATLFEVKYGTVKEELDQVLETDRMAVIFQNIDVSKRRYFQITPLFGTEKSHGAASDIYDWVIPFDPGPTPSTGDSGPTTVSMKCSDGSTPPCVIIDLPVSLCTVK